MSTAPTPRPIADPVKVDPKHYKMEFENDRVRVLRITYGPRERSVMHRHPGVVIFLTPQHSKFTYPDGKAEDVVAEPGTTRWFDAFQHRPENVGDQPFELVLVELKT